MTLHPTASPAPRVLGVDGYRPAIQRAFSNAATPTAMADAGSYPRSATC